MESAEAWRDCFRNWPADVRRRGVVVTSFGEQIPFAEFMTSDAILLAQRAAPDTVGARMVMVPYGDITGLKIIDPLRPQQLAPMGFTGGAAVRRDKTR